jgi:hypothetical protein
MFHFFAFITGIVAATLGTMQHLPHIHTLYIKRNKKNLSLITILTGLFIAILWAIYGYESGDLITEISSLITGAIHIILLTLYLYI